MFKKIDGKIDVQENRWRILPGIQMHRKEANGKFETQKHTKWKSKFSRWVCHSLKAVEKRELVNWIGQ